MKFSPLSTGVSRAWQFTRTFPIRVNCHIFPPKAERPPYYKQIQWPFFVNVFSLLGTFLFRYSLDQQLPL